MKFLIVSDIHGSLKYAQRAIEIFKEEACDQIICLGDVLYHGPRNPLPEAYNPKEVALLLNDYKDKIIGVRGNCDSEVDQMVLDFPMMADHQSLFIDGRRIFLTHGHLYHRDKMPKLSTGDVFIHGHYHIPMTDVLEGVYYLNPGSITLPKNNSVNSYAILEEGCFTIKDLKMDMIQEITFK